MERTLDVDVVGDGDVAVAGRFITHRTDQAVTVRVIVFPREVDPKPPAAHDKAPGTDPSPPLHDRHPPAPIRR